MRINIIGAGPTGLTIAWELAKLPYLDIHVYEKKPGPGGSWYEPDEDKRNPHAARAVFNRAFVNTQDLFRHMGIKWSDVFGTLSRDTARPPLKDLWDPNILKMFVTPSKTTTVKEVLNNKNLLALPYLFDGVSPDVMTVYEFINSLDYVALSKQETQIRSGAYMSRRMAEAVEARGVTFHYNMQLTDVQYRPNSFKATFLDGSAVKDGFLILCLDNGPASLFVKDNWGADAKEKITKGMYGSVTLMLMYDTPVKPMSELNSVIRTKWNIITSQIDDKTVLCTMPNTVVDSVSPEQLVREVVEQTGLPSPERTMYCWGSHWKNDRWVHDQTSGVITTLGSVPFMGENTKVALCGMMSPRKTPFASIEAAVEVGRTFCREAFGVGTRPMRPVTLSKLLLVIIICVVLWAVLCT